jgi:hypothetical protein
MDRGHMTAFVERHLKAEGAGDVDGAVSVYTDDVEHDVVGWPTGVLHVFEFRDGLISRENVWLDGAAIQQQLP